MGSALSTFNDFVDTTGPSFLTSAEDVVNEAVKNNYLLRRFLRGKGPSETVQGGSTIKDTIMFDDASTHQFYQPNDTFTWQNPQVLTNWELDWRYSVDHMSWTDQEIELNVGGGMGQKARHQQFKKLKRTKEQRLWTSFLNGTENALWAIPSAADMEGSAGTKPYSLPVFINEDDTDTGSHGGAFDTIQSIDCTTETKWRPQMQTYGDIAVNGSDNIISNFDTMWKDVRFVPPPSHQQYFDDPSLNAMFIACSKKGASIYTQLLRASQDTFVTSGREDPAYMKPKYAGIDIEYVSELDDYAGYTGGTGKEGGATKQGPRYYFINANYMKFVFHTSRYMHVHKSMRHPNQPFTTIVPVDNWYNFICRSRQRQGIVSPLAVEYTY